MKPKLICLIFSVATLFGSGGYDHGTSAGKGNWDISLTWNPFNYFKQGQSYVVVGYGITDRLDIQGYYSNTYRENDNFYGGIFYQFFESKRLNLSSAIGMRKFVNGTNIHLFAPQFLYTILLMDKVSIGGSFVDIRSQKSYSRYGTAMDVFLTYNVFENKKYKIDITAGGFNPVLWEPLGGDWHPTYSLDIKIKK